jgi:hypothetical protein
MFHSSVSLLIVALPNAEVPEGLMNYPVFTVETVRNTLMHSVSRIQMQVITEAAMG